MTRRESTDRAPVRARVLVEGVVQGVGFRPFVATLATRLHLAGFVGNDTHGVFIEIEGPPAMVDDFLVSVTESTPLLARIDHLQTDYIQTAGDTEFVIVASRLNALRDAVVTSDAATCIDCKIEIADPANRRFEYPFTNCTNCGPRFSIVRDLPYDRDRTTMAGFPMCARCQAEYDDPTDRRFHAQPVCCADCGPTLMLTTAADGMVANESLAETARLLRNGQVVAIKGLGGYHLSVDATNERAVAALRSRKHREDRPFALMVRDVGAARKLCFVDPAEAALLDSAASPIVLLKRRPGTAIASSVAPRTIELGVMLPYTPLHHLLLSKFDRPLVLTSGNRSDEPIAFEDLDAFDRLTGIADAWLTHDRPINTRVDDSVARIVAGAPYLIRRSRGYSPRSIELPWPFSRPVLGCGAEQKNTFALGRGRHAFVSHHIGDLENYETYASYTSGIEHLQRLLMVEPQVVAHDLHPDYLSTTYATELSGVDLVGVQHHHAHIASCLADNGFAGPVIGVAFDGTGLGSDSTIWGGEFLIADLITATRAAHLEPVHLPGASAAIRAPWRMAASYLDAAYGAAIPTGLAVAERHADQWGQVLGAAAAGINSPLTSSVGRLFDAVAVLLDVRDEVSYEGQAAIELEQLASAAEPGHYTATVGEQDVPRIQGIDLIRSVVADRVAGVTPAVIAGRFHHGLADLIVEVATMLRERHNLGTVALSGGVFQNLLLLERSCAGLRASGFEVLVHHQVPTNDGGISLGQAVVAGARDRAGLVGQPNESASWVSSQST